MSKVMMKCGHVAMATKTGTKAPCCPVCIGIKAEAEIIDDTPDLTGRTAKCGECRNTAISSIKLPFFRHDPEQAMDEYYCGCRGWD